MVKYERNNRWERDSQMRSETGKSVQQIPDIRQWLPAYHILDGEEQTMSQETIIKAVEGLSEEALLDVMEYIDFVKLRSSKDGVTEGSATHRHKKRTIGTMKGKIKMSEDFDEIPEGFKEYIK